MASICRSIAIPQEEGPNREYLKRMGILAFHHAPFDGGPSVSSENIFGRAACRKKTGDN